MSQNTTPHAEGWYTAGPVREEASAWYRAANERPSAPSAPPAVDPAAEKRRRRQRRTKAVSLSLCGVIVCAALAVCFFNSDLYWRMRGIELQGSDRAGVYYYDHGDGDVPGPVLPDEQYEDFREYFEHYYTSSSDIRLPAAPTGTGVKLRLYPRQEKELTLQEIYDLVSPAVVGINAYMDDLPYSWGTGVVFTSDGYIITNTHIIQGCSQARVVFADGTEYEALLVGADDVSDIAVLRIDGEDLPCARFGRSDALQVGDTAVAIGNPLGQEYTGTMTDGIISAIDRNVTYDGHTMTLLQTNAALNEGNSGGPLINAAGQVVGITNMKIMSSYMTTVEGIGFAIPSAVVKTIADQLIENGVVPGEPTIGIVAGSVSAEAMQLYGLPEGVYVSEVNEGSDALEKGLQVGDVITAVNGRHVASVAQVNAIKEGMAVGDTLTLTVFRDGETFQLDVELVDRGDVK